MQEKNTLILNLNKKITLHHNKESSYFIINIFLYLYGN